MSLAYAGQEPAKAWYFLHLGLGQAWRTTVTLTNLENQQVKVNLSAYDQAGGFLREISAITDLAAGATQTIEADTVLPLGSETLKLESSGNLVGSSLFERLDGKKSEALSSIHDASLHLDFPPLLQGDPHDKTITLLNIESAPGKLEVIALDHRGAELGRSLLPPLSPMASHTFTVQDLFSSETLQQLSTVRIVSDRRIVGLQLVDPPYADLVGLPALTFSSQEWSFPIVTRGGNVELWTAVGLFNPGEGSTSVTVEAFDAANNFLGIIDGLTLPPRATHFVITANMRGVIPSNTASLKVTSDQPISGYEVVGVPNGTGLTATLGASEEDQATVGYEIIGPPDGSTLSVSPLVRMKDGSIRSASGDIPEGYWKQAGQWPKEAQAQQPNAIPKPQALSAAQVTPSIQVTYPNGGESIAIGKTNNPQIQWRSSGLSATTGIRIDIKGRTGSWTPFIKSTPNTGKANWNWAASGNSFDTSFYTTDQYRIRVSGIANPSVSDQSDNTFTFSCGGVLSPGNPYPCCGNGGNCTYGAWEMARQNWNPALPSSNWGNASSWADAAKKAGYAVDPTPGTGTIAVNLTADQGLCQDNSGNKTACGHVAWVTGVSGNQVTVSQMVCGGTTAGFYPPVSRPASYFSRYIYNLRVTSFTIKNFAASTTSPIVTLNNTATGSPTQYLASESSTFSGASWQTYSAAPSFTLSAGNGNKTVYFKVRNSANVESVVVNDSITLSMPVPAAPNPPTNVSASDGTYPDKVVVSWTAPSSGPTPTGYKVFRNTANSTSGATQLGTAAASPYPDTTATPGTTYWYWVKAYNAGGDSGFSNGDSGYRAVTPPPLSVTVTSPNGGETWRAGETRTIAWTVSGDTTRLNYFKVKYSTDSGSGATWTDITAVGAGVRSVSWPILSTLSTTRARIQVKAFTASAELLAEDMSDGDFTIAPAVTPQVERLINGGFESGTTGWVFSGNFYASSGFSYPHTGSRYAYLSNPDGTPGNNLFGTMYQAVTIPSTARSATLTFWYNITSQETGSTGYDFLNVTIQDSSGGYLASVAFFSNLDKGTAGAYNKWTFDITPYKGRMIRIHFLGTTGSMYPTTFRIDDVSVMSDG